MTQTTFESDIDCTKYLDSHWDRHFTQSGDNWNPEFCTDRENTYTGDLIFNHTWSIEIIQTSEVVLDFEDFVQPFFVIEFWFMLTAITIYWLIKMIGWKK